MTTCKHSQPATCAELEPLAQTPVTLRVLTLIYNEEFEPEVIGIIHRQMTIPRYTKVRDVIGARADIQEETDYPLPGVRNHMLIIVAEHDTIDCLLADLKALRANRGHGLRAFVTPVEQVI